MIIATEPLEGKQGGIKGLPRTHIGIVQGIEHRPVGGERTYYRYLMLETEEGKTIEIPECCITSIAQPTITTNKRIALNG